MGAGGLPFENMKLQRVSNAVAAGTSAINSTGVDMTGYDGVTFLVGFGAITSAAVTSFNAAQGDTLGGAYVDLTGTAQSVADDDDNQIWALTIHRPGDRFVRCEVARATQNAVLDFIVAVRYRGDHPVTHDATTVGGTELHISPIEGTA